jgi:hypothetical protein
LKRAPAAAAETWTHDGRYWGQAWRMGFTIVTGDSYTFTAEAEDAGKLDARAGKWRAISPETGIVVEGVYQLTGADTFVLTLERGGPLGNTTWKRVRQ